MTLDRLVVVRLRGFRCFGLGCFKGNKKLRKVCYLFEDT